MNSRTDRHRAGRATLPELVLVGTALLLVLGLVVTAVGLAPAGTSLPAWWPAAGVGAGLVACSPRRSWPVLLVLLALATGAGNYLAGRPPLAATLLGLANAAEFLLVAWVLTAGGRRRPRLTTMDDVRRLVLASGLGALLVGLLVAMVMPSAVGLDFLLTWHSVTASHAAALLVLLPVVLLAVPGPDHGRRPPPAEVLAQLLVLASAVWLVFGGAGLPVAFVTVPPLLWAAFRFPPLLVVVETALLAVVVSWLTGRGSGPFGAPLESMSATSVSAVVQGYLVVVVLAALPLTVALTERQRLLADAVAGFETYRRVISESVAGTMLLQVNVDGLVVVEANDPACTLLATDLDTLRGRPWTAGLNERQRLEVERAARDLAAGTVEQWERELLLRCSRFRWVRLSLTWVPATPDGDLVAVQLVDLTDLHEASQDLAEQRDFTRAMLDSSDALLAVIDADGRVVRVNRAVEQLLGRTADELASESVWRILFDDEDVSEVRGLLRRGEDLDALAGDVGGEHGCRSASGERRTVRWNCATMRARDAGSLRVLTGIDVTEERRAQEKLQRVMASTTGTAVIGTDARGTITFFNEGAERVLGYDADAVIGRMAFAELHDRRELEVRGRDAGLTPGLDVVVRTPATTGLPEERDWTWRREDGVPVTVSLTVTPMVDGDGGVEGYLGVAADVTERRRSEAMLREALEQERLAVERLEELDRIKDDFVSGISHELRTPMTSVLGFTHLLRSGSAGPLTDRQHDLLERVGRNGHRLLALIEDLLTLARIESGTWHVGEDDVDLAGVVAGALEATVDERSRRSVRLVVKTERDADTMVLGDRDKLEQAVADVLSNAVKFTPDGGRVDVGLVHTGGMIRLAVSDNGIGIPKPEQHRVFERFYRASTAHEVAASGAGLGLAIVKQVVEAHRGQVRLDSTPGVGTRVELAFPAAMGLRQAE